MRFLSCDPTQLVGCHVVSVSGASQLSGGMWKGDRDVSRDDSWGRGVRCLSVRNPRTSKSAQPKAMEETHGLRRVCACLARVCCLVVKETSWCIGRISCRCRLSWDKDGKWTSARRPG